MMTVRSCNTNNIVNQNYQRFQWEWNRTDQCAVHGFHDVETPGVIRQCSGHRLSMHGNEVRSLETISM